MADKVLYLCGPEPAVSASSTDSCSDLTQLRSVPSGIRWKVMVECGMHNHRLHKDMLGHDILGRLKDDERKFVNDMTKYNMAPRYIVSTLKDKDPENITSITQIYRARATYRLGKRGALTEMKMLLNIIHQEKYMCWSINKENSDIVADIFWTHPDSVKLLNMFPLVLIFYCKYKTNRYRLPLLEIVGVTSTKLTFSVSFAYLEHEREENFTWALEGLKELFCSEKLLLHVLLGLQGKEKWMTIRDMSYNIASKYSVIFVSLSMLMNITVKLRPDCPLPPVTDYWRENCPNNAKAWESAYAGRFRHWKELSRKTNIRKNCSNGEKIVVLLY
ncbi:protein FAR1-RELATED SEQUENCE 5-like [Vicia villosa]|uniref:protein FAR1-RELATED SEQUENCE 5-like n=1 Tax=Vicia villosa TaxID=3911 RepID=UPI00273C8DDA|nr:protein FAR1-RELATED SEQUENCE 5-like [Vicia villosa]